MKHTILIILLGILLPVAATRAQTASDTLMMDYLRATGIPVTGNNRVKLLTTGRDKFADLFDAIRRARHHVHLEYFNFRNDSIANALFDLLAQKVQEGVEVRALFDAFGNWSNSQPLKEKHIKAIRARGIELVKFDPITFPYVNHALHRDHRKIVVIDGRTGYTGGMNVADYYITGLPKIGAWHDIHVRIDGDAVRYLQGIFLTMWNRETGQHVGGPEYFADIDIPEQEAEEVAIVDRVPRETPRSISHAYTAAIDSARHVVRIINPYFVPTKSIRTALKRALKRGVRVEIMIPSVSVPPRQGDDRGRLLLHGGHGQPEQPQLALRLRDERLHLRPPHHGSAQCAVRAQPPEQHAADAGHLETALGLEEVRRMVRPLVHACTVRTICSISEKSLPLQEKRKRPDT